MEMLTRRVDVQPSKLDPMDPLSYTVVEHIELLEAVLCPANFTAELIALRFDTAEGCFWNFLKPLRGNACVSLKSRACCASSRATVLFNRSAHSAGPYVLGCCGLLLGQVE